MSEAKIKQKLIDLIAEHFGIEENEVTPELVIRTDITANELELADFFQKVENEFSITITKEDSHEIQTIQDLITFITENADDFTQD